MTTPEQIIAEAVAKCCAGCGEHADGGWHKREGEAVAAALREHGLDLDHTYEVRRMACFKSGCEWHQTVYLRSPLSPNPTQPREETT